MNGFWDPVDKTKLNAHYSIAGLRVYADGVQALRAMFPDGKADEMNFCLFSTSGVHGTYTTLEDIEEILNKYGEEYTPDTPEATPDDFEDEVTFLVVHPRLVGLLYGNARVRTRADLEFLKGLRESSWKAAGLIGR